MAGRQTGPGYAVVRPLFLDSNVPILAFGAASPLCDACRAVLAAGSAGLARLHLSVEGGQEFLFHRLRRTGDPGRAAREFALLDGGVVWHPFDDDILRAAADVVGRGQLRGRDAVHAVTAVRAGFTEFVSLDPDFDAAPGLTRLDPRDLRF